MPVTEDPGQQAPVGSPWTVALSVLIALSVFGYVTGLTEDPLDKSVLPQLEFSSGGPVGDDLSLAPTYVDLRERPAGRTNLWDADQAILKTGLPDRQASVPDSPGQIGSVLTDRSGLRAFEGAPPTIPHPVAEGRQQDCLACHEDGLVVGGRVAPAMSHDRLLQCRQCHASGVAGPTPAPWLAPGPGAVPNRFDALRPPDQGPRAYGGAPPQIPHRSFMRERCESCHGVTGKTALRSSHPERRVCTQCHAVDAASDQQPMTGDGPPGGSDDE
jgi:cytochrome c-type protein NapB